MGINYYYLIYLAVFLAYYFTLSVIFLKIEFILGKLTKKSKTKIDDKLFEKLKRPFFYLLIFLGLVVETHFFNLPNQFKLYILKVLYSLIILIIAWIALRAFEVFIEHFVRKRKDDAFFIQLIKFLEGVVRIFLLILAILQILSIWNINITPLLASAGIIGLALALAAQQFLSNFFGGINLFFDRTFKVGDRVRINGKYLFVDEIGVRSTRFRTLENTYLIIPNSKLIDSEIENISEPKEPKKVRVKVGVAYGSDVDKVKEILKKVAQNNSYCINKDEVSVEFYEMGDYSLNFLVVFQVEDASKMWPAQVEFVEAAYKELTKNNIEIPFPTQTIYCKKEN